MIKLKDLLKESYVWERQFGEKLPTLADVQRKKLNEVGPKSSTGEETITIKHKTSGKKIVIVDTPASRKKYTKMGYIIPLPKHLQKLIKDLEKKDKEFKKYGVEVVDVVVPGLEWMSKL